jgi:hypothetical protein
MANRFLIKNRGFFNPAVVKANIAAKQSLIKSINKPLPPVPVGNSATPANLLRAEYENWLTAQKKAFSINAAASRAKGRMIALPRYPSFEAWAGKRLGLGLSDGVSGLGADFFTNIGKSLKAGLIKTVAPTVSKLTGVKVSKVTSDLNKIKTKVNVGKIVTNAVAKKAEKAGIIPVVPVIPVTDVVVQQAPDQSAGTPYTQQQGMQVTGGRFSVPKYVFPVVGGVVVVGVIYYVYSKQKRAA